MYCLHFLLFSIFIQTLILQVPTASSHSALSARNPSIIAQAAVEDSKLSESQFSLSDAALWSENNIFRAANEMTRLGASNTSQCFSSLTKLEMDIQLAERYALRMADSWGRRPSGVMQGDFRWEGKYYECTSVEIPEFNGKWCEALLDSGFKFATCLPDTCSDEEIESIYQIVANTVNLTVSSYCPMQPTEYTAIDIVALVICSLLGIIVISGTIYDVYLEWKQDEFKESMALDGDDLMVLEEHHSVWTKLLLSFSLIQNTNTLLDTTQKEGNINCLHGMRFISMTWVILGHSYLFILSGINNLYDYGNFYVKFGSFQAVANGTFSVDSFFFLSGLLAAYLGLREIEKRRGKMNVPLYYLSRYLRLTPAYALVILLSVSMVSKIGDGPTFPITIKDLQEPCQKYWWTNLLYINNLHPNTLDKECIGWSWYLGNDMQFSLLAPLYLLLIYKWPIAGIAVLTFSIFGSALSTGVLSAYYNLQPDPVNLAMFVKLITLPQQTTNATMYDSVDTTPAPEPSQSDIFWSDIYAKPWCRIGVYLIGLGTGYFLHKTKFQLRLHKFAVLGIWIVTAIVELSVVYGLWGSVHDMSTLPEGISSFYLAVSRPVWALGLAWVTIACVNGYGGPINTFLSWKCFIPLSRLTYCTYLIHPIVITYFYSYREISIHFSVNDVLCYYIASLTMSVTVAYVISMTIEAPMAGIQKVLLPKKSHLTTRTEGITNINYTNGDVHMSDPNFHSSSSMQYKIST